jgi:hypothetical protein
LPLDASFLNLHFRKFRQRTFVLREGKANAIVAAQNP